MVKTTYVINAYYKYTVYIKLQEVEKRDGETFIGYTIKAYGTTINSWESLLIFAGNVCYYMLYFVQRVPDERVNLLSAQIGLLKTINFKSNKPNAANLNTRSNITKI